ncbi:hypothetical protein [Nocardia brasiliensis]|uniref:hypothetical protein n=1 Tax=Nocardia brasiliensis TaxID=37326 RepID=UPI002455501C|nr:hypothetical protein [Nocardia brasiliensis]
MNHGLVAVTPARTSTTIDRKGTATMADKTTAQTTIDAVLRRFAPTEAVPAKTRKRQHANGFPGAARLDRTGGQPRHRSVFRAAPQRPLRIPGRG